MRTLVVKYVPSVLIYVLYETDRQTDRQTDNPYILYAKEISEIFNEILLSLVSKVNK